MSKIDLPGDIEAWAREEVAAGRAVSVDALIAETVREQRLMVDGHKAKVEQAYRSLDAGDVLDEASMDADLDRWIAEDLVAAQ